MKTILLLGALLLLVAVLRTEAYKRHRHGHIVVGFAACLRGNFKARKLHQTVVFGDVQTNIGHHYNNRNGVFTAPVNEMYVFIWNILTMTGKIGDNFLMVNGRLKRSNSVNSYAYGNFGFRTGSSSIVLSLKRNDRVKIVGRDPGNVIHGGTWSSFQGWLQNRM